jgi:hypothetical protein
MALIIIVTKCDGLSAEEIPLVFMSYKNFNDTIQSIVPPAHGYLRITYVVYVDKRLAIKGVLCYDHRGRWNERMLEDHLHDHVRAQFDMGKITNEKRRDVLSALELDDFKKPDTKKYDFSWYKADWVEKIKEKIRSWDAHE